MKILIIEQEKTFLQSLRNFLEYQENVEVFWANSGREGLSLWHKGGFDLILCAERLPDGSGLQTLKDMIRECPGIKSVLMTARHDEHLRKEALNAGIRIYLEKPFELQQLEEAMGVLHP
jgi:DNA-binding response OmpR family regulator